jgi:hypothetical protein
MKIVTSFDWLQCEYYTVGKKRGYLDKAKCFGVLNWGIVRIEEVWERD